ncbi:HNH endonuclease [Psychrobacter sp. ASPA161_9]|uniref:HNH endonuclease n=1 Tax=Psychrobacter sp. ASPA161_9 TaxID=3160961 RepID=UPI003F7F8DD7
MIRIDGFNSRNNISNSEFDVAIHNQILLIVFKEIVSILESKKDLKIDILDGYRSVIDKQLYTMRFIKKHISIEFSGEELDTLSNWIFAYFRKSTIREKITDDKKEILLSSQRYKCFYCKKDILISNLEVDHKVPFSLVGEELDNNLVATCFSCNREKKDKIDLGLKWLIMKK